VRADLTDPGWPDSTGLAQPWDAAVSSTALHWLQPDALRELYRTVAARLRPGGVFVDADHRTHTDPVASELARHVRDARAERAGVTGNEEWGAWWEAVLADPELGALVEARSATAIAHSGGSKLTLEQQRAALREAGFSTVTTVWQCGDDLVLVAVR
jgi:SAM-dependent methyltransferase